MTDDRPGIRRLKARGSFRYIMPDGKPLTDKVEVARITSLAIPPAYTDVWIAPIRNAHLQATGRDARGRKQYRYHKRWREVRDETKFDRMLAFAKALPKIRAAVKRDLAKTDCRAKKCWPPWLSLLEATMIRVGNEEYARENDSHGLTTMQDTMVNVRGDAIRFNFRGKSGISHNVTVRDKRLAKIVRSCQDIPGHELFSYLDECGDPVSVDSSDVNDYIRTIADDDFTAKDFRTWEATMSCALALANVRVESDKEAKAAVVAAVASGGGAPRQHARGLPEIVHLTGRDRRVHRQPQPRSAHERSEDRRVHPAHHHRDERKHNHRPTEKVDPSQESRIARGVSGGFTRPTTCPSPSSSSIERTGKRSGRRHGERDATAGPADVLEK